MIDSQNKSLSHLAEVELPPEYLLAQKDLKAMMSLTSQFMLLTVLRTIREDPTTRKAISAGYKVPVLQGLREHYNELVLDTSLGSLGLFSAAKPAPQSQIKGKKGRKRGDSDQPPTNSGSSASNVAGTSKATSREPASRSMLEVDKTIVEKFGPHSAAYHEAREDLEKMLSLNRQFFMITTYRMICDHPKYREILALKELRMETLKDVEGLEDAASVVFAPLGWLHQSYVIQFRSKLRKYLSTNRLTKALPDVRQKKPNPAV